MNYQVKFLLIGLGLLAACEMAPQKKELSSGLYLEHVDSTVNPGDNFHMFVNGTWINNTPIPEDKSSYGVGYIVHEQSQDNVKAIIEESASGEYPVGSDEQKVGDLYASFMDTVRRDEVGIAPLLSDFEKIDALKNVAELTDYFAIAGTFGINMPVGVTVFADLKNPNLNRLYVFQGGLGLPDREYYLADNEDFNGIRESYQEHIAKMFELCELDNSQTSASTVMSVETKLASNHWKKEDNRDPVKIYNLFSTDSLSGITSNFNWSSFLTNSGLDGLDTLVFAQPSYAEGLNELLLSISLDDWKTYLKWCVIDDAASRLNSELDAQNFAFYGTRMRGIETQRPMWRRGVDVVNGNLGEVVGKVYVSRHFPPAAKQRMSELVDNLLAAYETSIKSLDWMSEETRTQALDKLSKFNAKIGYPDKWKDYTDLEISADDFFGNMRRSKYSEHMYYMAKVGKEVDKTEWSMTPQTVNAYYNPTKNEIVFPAAILQPPFFDMDADDAVNYGAIGAIIGHEIGHGFDDKGSTFDGDGVLRNWWTDEDREEFENRTKALIAQYDSYKVFDDLNVNGAFTLGENIGDLGGLSIAVKAYKLSLNGQEAPVMEGLTGLQRVFMGYAQAWRGKAREQALRMQINTDPHSPGIFRVNGVVRNVPEFYEAFNIQEGDSLYLAESDRVKIW